MLKKQKSVGANGVWNGDKSMLQADMSRIHALHDTCYQMKCVSCRDDCKIHIEIEKIKLKYI